MRFLEIAATDLRRWNLRRDRKHRHPAPMGIEQPVDQMQVAWPTRAGTDREATRDVCFTGGCEGSHLLMPHMHPFDAAPLSQRLRETVQTVSDDAINSLDACLFQSCHDEIGDVVGHHQFSGSGFAEVADERLSPFAGCRQSSCLAFARAIHRAESSAQFAGARERRPKTSLVLKHPDLASYIGTGEVRRTHARAGASNHFMERGHWPPRHDSNV